MQLSISALTLFLSAASSLVTTVRAEATHGFFTYVESSAVGPSHWDKVEVEDNQCNVTGVNAGGYGQSPVAISDADTCETDMSAYTFNPTTCTWDQLEFLLQKNGVKVQVLKGENCSLGSMTIPQKSKMYNATQFHIHTFSEHTIDDKTFQAELHVVHEENDPEGLNASAFAVFANMISGGAADDHVVFENYLRGWEKAALAVDQTCAAGGVIADNETLSSTHANNSWTPVQTKVTCPAVGKSTYTEESFDTDAEPNVYNFSSDPNFGVYTYKGGFTTPPCTEDVDWNLVDTPILLSDSQMTRLYNLILCFTDPETCLPSSIASKDGGTNRPTQPLNGRPIVHRCRTCDGCETTDEEENDAGENADNATAPNVTGPVFTTTPPPPPPSNNAPPKADENATATTNTSSSGTNTTSNTTSEDKKNTTNGNGGKKGTDVENKSSAAGTSFLPFSLGLMLLTFLLV